MLSSVDLLLVTDISGQPIGYIMLLALLGPETSLTITQPSVISRRAKISKLSVWVSVATLLSFGCFWVVRFTDAEWLS